MEYGYDNVSATAYGYALTSVEVVILVLEFRLELTGIFSNPYRILLGLS